MGRSTDTMAWVLAAGCLAVGCADRCGSSDRPQITRADVPAPTEPPPTYVDVEVGPKAVCGLRDTGAVRCWFDGERVDAVFSGRARAIALAQGAATTSVCVLVDDGTVACGRLGARPFALSRIDALSGVSSIAPRANGFCAVADGRVSCWSATTRTLQPVATSARAEALFGDADAGCRYTLLEEFVCGRDPSTCARLEGGRMACWSSPERDGTFRAKDLRELAGVGELTITPGRISWLDAEGAVHLADLDVSLARLSRVHVLSDAPPASESAGTEYDLCIRTRGGEVACRGNAVPSARRAPSPSAFVAIAESRATTRLASAFRATCALASGRLLCWGDNREGRLGVRGSRTDHPPLDVAGIENARELFVMDETVCVARAGAGVACWGKPFEFARADAWSTPTDFPVPGATAIDSVHGGGCAITDEAPYCWGSLSPRHVAPSGASPTNVSDEDGHEWAVAATTEDPGLARIEGLDAKPVEVAVTYGVACVRTDAGAMHCWYESEGRAGEATIVPTLARPERVIDSGVERIGAFGQSICARLLGGSMRCIRRVREVNANGPRLGEVRLMDEPWPFAAAATAWASRIPVSCGLFDASLRCLPESVLAGATSVRATRFDVGGRGVGRAGELCVLVEGGNVACLDPRIRPAAGEPRFTPVDGVRDAVDLGLGDEFGCALLDSGRVSCWGQNRHGELVRGGDVDDVAEPRGLE